jgi:hypothetical protein
MADYRYADDVHKQHRRDDQWSNRDRGGRDAWSSDRGGMFGGRERDRDSERQRQHARSYGQRERERAMRERDDRFNNDDTRREFPINETSRLIASNKIEGTPVYSRDGDRLGSIYNFMVDKRSGQVEYAVMSFGGFLGMGQDYYPLPWDMLTYDTEEDGYVVDLHERDLDEAPRYRRGQEPRYDREYDRYVASYWGTMV